MRAKNKQISATYHNPESQDMREITAALDDRHAMVRKSTLQKLALTKWDSAQLPLVREQVLIRLADSSVMVQRQAVKTLLSLKLEAAPDELLVLMTTTEDQTLRTLIRSTLRRIQLRGERAEGVLEERKDVEYIFSVSDFILYLNQLLSQEIVRIKGEVSEIKTFRDNLVFFSLRDAAGVVNCWFPKNYQYQWGVELQDGLEVVAKVKPQISAKSGRFGLRVLELTLCGAGSLKMALEKITRKLEAEGLFAAERKRRLPFLPDQIGLITGDDSAAYSDFVKVLLARMGGTKVHFAPVRVQGVGSIAEICGAIKYLNNLEPAGPGSRLDVIVLTRGGGSLEDLQSFNSEEVTRAVFSSTMPIVAAVGHEQDWSLAELAADLRASTPSNAAELLIPDRLSLLNELDSRVKFCRQSFDHLIGLRRQSVSDLVKELAGSLERRITYYNGLINSLNFHFQSLIRKWSQAQASFTLYQTGLLSNFENYYRLKKHRFQALYQLLLSYSPRAVLKRGYSVVKIGAQILKSASQAKVGEEINIYPYEGEIKSEVKEIRN
ncbi:MAG: exodeoxyribonuclease VII large subunit [Candidatus Jacksonbacteria bacterium RIFOXYC2_FULL_44_29]|nr:MAG: exodeoxyribonuclease VII large subunit [Candidatus Jacksonbacteria bacterium RIFOXYB2_FULL_44_15]OGY77606.1 MAG: exodeoxyribonuclease VII large subunit [Candidatus Jacksonbacteria bacterium RIFOXYC2_FULL_44_29]OGY80228.1 MAG: exodeoxyribonuclease VII large subunit [Candidatus Jacksonbacteria bacterium RIFOXYD2_FULL_43_21]